MTGSPFDGIPELIETSVKQKKGPVEWEGPIPARAVQMVKEALANPDKRFHFPYTDVEAAKTLYAGLRAALGTLEPEKELHTRHSFDKETKAMTRFGYSVGDKRGRKPKVEAE